MAKEILKDPLNLSRVEEIKKDLLGKSLCPIGSESLLSSYHKTLDKFKPLDKKDQYSLACAYREGDAEAGQALVLTNLRFSVLIASQYLSEGINKLELIQEGNLGLLQALKRFDPDRGVNFTSYAVFWVRHHILAYIKGSSMLTANSASSRKTFLYKGKLARELQKEGKELTPEILAERMEINYSDAVALMSSLATPISLDTDFEDNTLFVEASQEETLLDKELSEKVQKIIKGFLQTLKTERQKEIFLKRIVAGEEALTLAEIGERHKVSRERIRQIEAKIKPSFYRYLHEQLGRLSLSR